MPHPPPPVPRLLARLIEPLYAAGIASRNRRFDRAEGVTRFPIPVISVGNLSVGGTGKTPMVALLVAELRAAGRNPCIAMRGYQPRRARRAATPTLSDEAALYKQTFPDLPIVAQPDRTAGLRRLLASSQQPGAAASSGGASSTGASGESSGGKGGKEGEGGKGGGRGVDCIVLDDGFQHRQIARDLDIVLIDASRSPFEDHLLPRGWLREPTSSLRRAHAVVITHAELAAPDALARLEADVTHAHGRPPLAVARHAWSHLAVLDPATGADVPRPVADLAGKRILTVCAIGNPAPFQHAAESIAAAPGLVTHITLPDHDPFAPHTVQRITRAAADTGADLILTTEKDWTKLAHLPPATWPVPIARPHLTLTFDRGRDALLTLALTTATRRPEE